MKSLYVVVGGQFGSEGKGAAVGAMMAGGFANEWAAVRVAGPNAGHTIYTYDPEPRKVVVRSVPAAVVKPGVDLFIGPGSEIDVGVLASEMARLSEFKVAERLVIHPQATILEPKHAQEEGGNDGPMQNRIGSTGKGVGAARADRIMRTAQLARDLYDLPAQTITHSGYLDWLGHRNVLIEGTQGYGLGLHAGFYPFCTSSDCTAIDFLSMAGLSPWEYDVKVWLVVRTYPIRVAGNSGPLPFETTWEALADRTDGYVQPEYTTVTKKLRRVAEYDPDLVADAVRANGGSLRTSIMLMFLDYIDPEVAGVTDDERLTPKARRFISMVESTSGADVDYVGTSPHSGVWL